MVTLAFFWDSSSLNPTVTGSCFPASQSPVTTYTVGWVNKDHSLTLLHTNYGPKHRSRHVVSPMGSLHSRETEKNNQHTHTHKYDFTLELQGFGNMKESGDQGWYGLRMALSGL